MKRTVIIRSLLILALIAAACPGQEDHSGHDHANGDHAATDDSFALGTGAQATLAIQAVQGTEGGPDVGADSVIVELLHQRSRIHMVEDTLDDSGAAVIGNLSLAVPFVPRVTVVHDEAYYQTIGEPMDAGTPHQDITVTVYEITEEPVAWEVSTQHVFVHAAPNGVHVQETLVVRNPTDRSWLGPVNTHGFRTSVAIDLPANASEIQVGGALDLAGSKLVASRIYSTRPLVPGQYELVVSYVMPVIDGQTHVEITAAAPVGQLVVFIPTTQEHLEESVQLHGEGLAPGDIHNYHGQQVRAYHASDLAAGQRVGFTLTGLGGPGEQADDSSLTTPQILAIIGGALIVAVLVAIMLIKPKTKPEST